jgi:hypothetical protein
VTFSGVPANVVIAKEVASESEPAEMKIEDGTLKLHAIALPDAVPGEYTIKVRARAGIWQQEEDINLTVEPLKYFMPSGWRKGEDAKWRDIDNRIFYDKIDIARDKIDPVRFLFIPGKAADPYTTPIYMMETKVWEGLYKVFQQLHAKDLLKKAVKLSGVDRLPIFGVPPEDANQFAEWLVGSKGRLPRVYEWDVAIGRYEPGAGQGPYRDTLTKDVSLDIAVRWDPNKPAHPRPVGEARDDVSIFGIKDVAGNGREYTCNVSVNGEETELHKVRRPLRDGEFVSLRGWKYSEGLPLTFEDLKSSISYDPGTPNLVPASFRVVFEP